MIGETIGSYRIVQKLGEGGMGAVYVAQHALLGRKAAIKVLLPALSSQPEVVHRFFNEARAVTSISDPGVVQVFDFGHHRDGSAFIVMELLDGEPLATRLARCGRLSMIDALRVTRQVAVSLATVHAHGIVHRDLKPENVFLVRDPEIAHGERAKILDFGIAKLSAEQSTSKTHAGALLGTPTYMSPEQCRGAGEVDYRSDLYSLGCMLFHLVVGQPPFVGAGLGEVIAAHLCEPAPSPSSRLPGLPPAFDALVLRCLAKAPGERFATMGELASAIDQLLPQLVAAEQPTRMFSGAMPAPPSLPGAYATPAPGLASAPGLPGAAAASSYPGLPSQPTTLGLGASAQLRPPGGRASRWGRVVAGVSVLSVGALIAVVLSSRGGGAGPQELAPAASPVTAPAPSPAPSPAP